MKRWKKILLFLVMLMIVATSIFVTTVIMRGIFSTNAPRTIANTPESSIVYYVNNDVIIKAEVRVIGVIDKNNPIVVYIPFAISKENIKYDENTHLIAIKKYDKYTLVSVFLYERNIDSVFLELSNQDTEIQRSVDFSSVLENNEKKHVFEVVKVCDDFSSHNKNANNICLIKHHFINIASPFFIAYKSNGKIYYTPGEQNENIQLEQRTNSYYFSYKSPAAISENKEDSPLFLVITLLVLNIFGPLPTSVYSLLKEKTTTSEKIPLHEKVAFSSLLVLGIASIAISIVFKIGIVVCGIIAFFGLVSLVLYIIARRNNFLTWIRSLKKKESRTD